MEHPHAAQPLAARQEPAACHPLDRVVQGAVEAPCPLAAQAWAMPVLQQAAQRQVLPMLVEREATPIAPIGRSPTLDSPRDMTHQTMCRPNSHRPRPARALRELVLQALQQALLRRTTRRARTDWSTMNPQPHPQELTMQQVAVLMPMATDHSLTKQPRLQALAPC